MRKILFDTTIANSFEVRYYPLPWPVPVGDFEQVDIEVEFNPQGGDLVHEAAAALDVIMKERYPNKEYKYNYWWWLN